MTWWQWLVLGWALMAIWYLVYWLRGTWQRHPKQEWAEREVLFHFVDMTHVQEVAEAADPERFLGTPHQPYPWLRTVRQMVKVYGEGAGHLQLWPLHYPYHVCVPLDDSRNIYFTADPPQGQVEGAD